MVRSITLTDELQARFDACVIKAKGYKRGNKKTCAEEAIKDWCEKIEKRVS
jgi:hypothetical protein